MRLWGADVAWKEEEQGQGKEDWGSEDAGDKHNGGGKCWGASVRV